MSLRQASRAAFAHCTTIQTRWADNDIYGHVNNVAYYSYFDTAVNGWLIEQGLLDIHDGDVVGYVVETGCSYFGPVAFPDTESRGAVAAPPPETCPSWSLVSSRCGVSVRRSIVRSLPMALSLG